MEKEKDKNKNETKKGSIVINPQESTIIRYPNGYIYKG